MTLTQQPPRLRAGVLVMAAGCSAWVALMSFALLGCPGSEPATARDAPIPPSRTADLILTGGKIKTSHGWAEALAVRHGVIVAIGDANSVEALRTSATRTINLTGDTV